MKCNQEIRKLLPISLRASFDKLSNRSIYEIRLRVNAPAIFSGSSEIYATIDGDISKKLSNAYILSARDIEESLDYISSYSLYAFENELRQGFITVKGGHRVGLTGQTVIEDNEVKSVRNISYINIRVAHEVKGCANDLMPYLCDEDIVYHTMIISAPGCGKTTMLRDVVRQLSNGNNKITGTNIGLVDERSEVAACYMGAAQNDIGIRTDVIDNCPKSIGMMMLIRSMSPKVIAVDELGFENDIRALEYCMNCGCKVITTIHGRNIGEIRAKPLIGNLIKNRAFERYVILTNKNSKGHIDKILDSRGSILWCSK